MSPAFDIVDDTILPSGGSGHVPNSREWNVHMANIVVLALPIAGSFIVRMCSSGGDKNERSKKLRIWSAWSFAQLVVLWFWSVSIFGALLFLQSGFTNRLTFMFAILHTQVEVLLITLLLNVSLSKAAVLAGTFGLVLALSTFVIPSMTVVFFLVSIGGGAIDALIPLVLIYGRQRLYATGAFFHFISAIWVFSNSVIFFDIVLYNTLVFASVALFVSFTVLGFIHDVGTFSRSDDNVNGYSRLPSSLETEPLNPANEPYGQHEPLWRSGNPMGDLDVPPSVLVSMVGASLVVSSVITSTLYVLA